MKLQTWKRSGDGTWHHEIINVEVDMKLKCNLCMEKHGNAVKTDQLVLVTIKGRDYLACIKCAEKVKGRISHELTNADVRN